MRKLLTTLLIAPVALALHAQPIDLIIDCDAGNDIDDLLAIGIAHVEQTAGNCNLLALTSTKDHALSAACLRKVNAFYGRPDIPIGIVTNGSTKDEGKYLKLAANEPARQYPEAVRLLRQLLAKAKDQNVVIAQIGFSTNLARLLDTTGDEFSPLTGVELVKQKVRFLSIMAGDIANTNHVEYNIACDIPSALKLVDKWPGKIIFSAYEVGLATCFPGDYVENNFPGADNPLREGYRLYCGYKHNRPCWDLTSVYYAIHPETDLYGHSPIGRMELTPKGISYFHPDPNGQHIYLTVTPEQIAKNIAVFKDLCSRAPKK